MAFDEIDETEGDEVVGPGLLADEDDEDETEEDEMDGFHELDEEPPIVPAIEEEEEI